MKKWVTGLTAEHFLYRRHSPNCMQRRQILLLFLSNTITLYYCEIPLLILQMSNWSERVRSWSKTIKLVNNKSEIWSQDSWPRLYTLITPLAIIPFSILSRMLEIQHYFCKLEIKTFIEPMTVNKWIHTQIFI